MDRQDDATQPAVPSGNPPPTPSTLEHRRSWRRRIGTWGTGSLLVWVVAAYLIMPELWHGYMHRHPSLADIPNITHTGSGIDGDPLNVALIGTQPQLMKTMVAAQWYPADSLTLRSCLEIAEATVLKRPYKEAPVSSLFLFGRREDLAFERPVGNDPRKRHHVRFWKTPKSDPDGRPVWIGSAVYDEHVGLSRTTGQITHVTGPDIDTERAKLFADLHETGDLEEIYFVDGFHTVLKGRNGGGDPWFTDGRLEAGVIKAN